MDVAVAPINASSAATAAAAKIEKCVHCGFCLTACPTYQLDSNELDSPRGRIFLVKKLIENTPGAARTARRHLDSCLTCRSCETACPSGVQYEQIASFGRKLARKRAPRDMLSTLGRFAVSEAVRNRTVGRIMRRTAQLLPYGRRIFPQTKSPAIGSQQHHSRSVALLAGCAQESLMPETNRSLSWLLGRAGFSCRTASSRCCGAIRHHLARKSGTRDAAATVKSCIALLDSGAEAILAAASGCAAHIKTYGEMFAGTKLEHDARRVADAIADPADFLHGHIKALEPAIANSGRGRRVVMHTPCTMRNALGSSADNVGALLKAAGYAAVAVPTPNCCGSAGTYAVFERRKATRLRRNMLDALDAAGSDLAISANIGCILHMRGGNRPTIHWADAIAGN